MRRGAKHSCGGRALRIYVKQSYRAKPRKGSQGLTVVKTRWMPVGMICLKCGSVMIPERTLEEIARIFGAS